LTVYRLLTFDISKDFAVVLLQYILMRLVIHLHQLFERKQKNYGILTLSLVLRLNLNWVYPKLT